MNKSDKIFYFISIVAVNALVSFGICLWFASDIISRFM